MEKQDSSTDLAGLLVVTIEQAVAAPYVSCRLADAGARVIKVERPEGDFARSYDSNVLGNSAYFVWLNRGKESIALNLKDDKSVIDGVMWKGISGNLSFRPEDGLEVICTGKLTTYPGRSKYQIVIERMEPAGAGALMALLE